MMMFLRQKKDTNISGLKRVTHVEEDTDKDVNFERGDSRVLVMRADTIVDLL